MDKEVKRIPPSVRQNDLYVMNAIQGVSGYAPVKPELKVEALLVLQQKMFDLQRIEVQKQGEFKAARDNAVKAEHALHQALLAAKDQFRAQFGISSDEYQSIGLKKKNEYKSRTRKA